MQQDQKFQPTSATLNEPKVWRQKFWLLKEEVPLSLCSGCASIQMIRTLEIKYTDEKAAINADATDL